MLVSPILNDLTPLQSARARLLPKGIAAALQYAIIWRLCRYGAGSYTSEYYQKGDEVQFDNATGDS